MNQLYLLLLLLSVSFAKYSYSDKCYRFKYHDMQYQKSFIQVYVNKKGVPLSHDTIVHEYTYDSDLSVQYYYHQILTNCTKNESVFNCVSITESVWFKIVNATAAKAYVKTCDPVFYKKYGDITKHKCDNDGKDPFEYLYQQIGFKSSIAITMEDGVPHLGDYKQDGECVWEYEILGLWSIVAIVVLSSCIVGALLFIIVIWVIAQKHRSNKRKRLDNALIGNHEPQI